MSGGALATAGALATMSIAYRLGGLTSFLLGKTVEAAAGQAFELTLGSVEPGYETIYKHSIQYSLMEMDVEAKVSAVRSLVRSLQTEHLASNKVRNNDEDYVTVAVNNLNDIMAKLLDTLNRVYGELDSHALKWFNTWRKPYVFEDLDVLRAQCKAFDKRLDMLTKCLAIEMSIQQHRAFDSHSGELSKLAFHAQNETTKYSEERTTIKNTTESIFFKDDAVVL